MSKVAVVDVFCAFRMLLCAFKMLLGTPPLGSALRPGRAGGSLGIVRCCGVWLERFAHALNAMGGCGYAKQRAMGAASHRHA